MHQFLSDNLQWMRMRVTQVLQSTLGETEQNYWQGNPVGSVGVGSDMRWGEREGESGNGRNRAPNDQKPLRE